MSDHIRNERFVFFFLSFFGIRNSSRNGIHRRTVCVCLYVVGGDNNASRGGWKRSREWEEGAKPLWAIIICYEIDSCPGGIARKAVLDSHESSKNLRFLSLVLLVS